MARNSNNNRSRSSKKQQTRTPRHKPFPIRSGGVEEMPDEMTPEEDAAFAALLVELARQRKQKKNRR